MSLEGEGGEGGMEGGAGGREEGEGRQTCHLQSCQVELYILNFLSLFRDLQKSTRFSGGGVVAEFFRVLQKPTRFSGGGGGVVTEIVSYLQLRNHFFTPHRVIFVGRDTQFLLDTAKITTSC